MFSNGSVYIGSFENDFLNGKKVIKVMEKWIIVMVINIVDILSMEKEKEKVFINVKMEIY